MGSETRCRDPCRNVRDAARINQGQKHCGVMLSGFCKQDHMRQLRGSRSAESRVLDVMWCEWLFLLSGPGGGEPVITRCTLGFYRLIAWSQRKSKPITGLKRSWQDVDLVSTFLLNKLFALLHELLLPLTHMLTNKAGAPSRSSVARKEDLRPKYDRKKRTLTFAVPLMTIRWQWRLHTTHLRFNRKAFNNDN